MSKDKVKKKTKLGKWSRDPWIRILELLNQMPKNERDRCIKATSDFFRDDHEQR
jgi:hypothetical protein